MTYPSEKGGWKGRRGKREGSGGGGEKKEDGRGGDIRGREERRGGGGRGWRSESVNVLRSKLVSLLGFFVFPGMADE